MSANCKTESSVICLRWFRLRSDCRQQRPKSDFCDSDQIFYTSICGIKLDIGLFFVMWPQSEQSYQNSDRHSSQYWAVGSHLMNTNMEDSCDGGNQWRDSEVLDLISILGWFLYKQPMNETMNSDLSSLHVYFRMPASCVWRLWYCSFCTFFLRFSSGLWPLHI